MKNGIIITTYFPGKIGGSVSHTEKQAVRTDLSKVGSKKPIWATVNILHSDRPLQKAYRKTKISGELIEEWTSGTVPFWSNKKEWSKFTKQQRLISYVSRYDEGYGVTFEEI